MAHLILLIQLISSRGGFGPLLNKGLTYSQISALIEEGFKSGYLSENTDNDLIVTENGLSFLREHCKKSLWITHQDKYRIPRSNVKDVYLPELKSSFFKDKQAH